MSILFVSVWQLRVGWSFLVFLSYIRYGLVMVSEVFFQRIIGSGGANFKLSFHSSKF